MQPGSGMGWTLLASELRSPWQQDGSAWKGPVWRVTSGLRLQQKLWLERTLAYF